MKKGFKVWYLFRRVRKPVVIIAETKEEALQKALALKLKKPVVFEEIEVYD